MFYENFYYPNYLQNNDIDLHHIPQNGIGLSKDYTVPCVVTIHDLIPYTMPETCGKGYLTRFLKDMPYIIESNYDINISYIEQIKNAYKIDAKDRGYCLKVIGYKFPHFYFILSAMKHLQKKGFKTIPAILKTKNNMDFIKLGNKFAYVT
ncbi:hypothetical protein H9X77_13365, partial [Clostridium saudiense]|nr:hypothetical protein [Clostridium saudiense]